MRSCRSFLRKLFAGSILLILTQANINAQDIYLGVGYTASYWPLVGLNNVIDHYQDQRINYPPSVNPEDEYTSSVGSINLLAGWTGSFGYLIKENLNLEVKYMNRRNNQWSSQVETAAGESFQRSLNLKTNTIGFGASRLILGKKRDFIVGGTIDFTNLDVDVTEANQTAFGVVSQTMFGFTGFMKFIYYLSPKTPLGLSFNPYMQFNLIPADFGALNQTLNPNTYRQLSTNQTKGGYFNFGIEVQLAYFIYTRFNKGE